MGAVFFYHLTQRPLEATLPILLGKARAQSWRIEVRGTRDEFMRWLDEKLWMGADDGFMPHGMAGGAHDAKQPILLSTAPVGGTECLMCIDGAAPSPDDVTAAQRTCVLFDGHDPDAVQTARGHWKALTDAGCAAQYWSEESGSWQKKAETGG